MCVIKRSSEIKKYLFKLINYCVYVKTINERDIFRLMKNSVSGKTIKENINAKNISHVKFCFEDEKEAKKLFQELSFYNVLIEKPKLKV